MIFFNVRMRWSELSVPSIIALWFIYSAWVLGTPFLVDTDSNLTKLPDTAFGLFAPLVFASALGSLVLVTLGTLMVTSK